MASLSASKVVTPTGLLENVTVAFEGGVITSVREDAAHRTHAILAPGFVDLQVNGIDDIDVASARGVDWDVLDQRLVAQGVTAWCPTLVSAPLSDYAGPLGRIADAAGRTGRRPAILGVHLEGPFLGGAPGAHPVERLLPIDAAWLAALPPIVRLVTLAPELDGAADAIAALVGRGVTVALGHSVASFEQATAAIDAGARLVTHGFNGMGPLHHRQPGLLGAALSDDRVALSLIADLVHVHPAALSIAFRAKGAKGAVLVTDAVAWSAADGQEQPTTVVDGAARLADGTLAGSCITMDTAVRNAVQRAGVPLWHAVAAASMNPAAVLGAGERGCIAVGARADLVALDDELRMTATWIGGEQVYGR